MENKLILDEVKNENSKKENKFLSRIEEEIEVNIINHKNTLLSFLRENFEVIEKYIDTHKKSSSKNKVYDDLAKIINETEEDFKNYKVTGENLAKYISKIREEKNCQKQKRVNKNKKTED